MTFVSEWYVDSGYSPTLGTGTYRKYAVNEQGQVFRMVVDPLHGSLWKRVSA